MKSLSKSKTSSLAFATVTLFGMLATSLSSAHASENSGRRVLWSKGAAPVVNNYVEPQVTRQTKPQLVSASKAAQAGEIYVVEQPLGDLLKAFARQNGYGLRMGRSIRGTVRNQTFSTDLTSALNDLGESFEFDWYVEDGDLQIIRRNERISKMLYLGSANYEGLKSNLRQAGISNSDIDIRYISESNSVLVNGPPSLVARIELLAAGAVRSTQAPMVIRGGRIQ